VPYRGDLVRWKDGALTLGGGNGGAAVVIPMAKDPGAIVKAELLFDEVLVTVSRPDLAASAPGSRPEKKAAGDPGQRFAWTILTEDRQSFMFNGRGLVSEKIRHAKKLGHLRSAQDRHQPKSRRAKKIKRHIAREKAKSARRVRDLNHKITCGVQRECVQAGVTTLVLSQPDGIAQAPGRKAQRQRNGLWEYGEQSRQIAYKAEGLFEVVRAGERGTSSTCPKCQHRCHPSGRLFRCPACGWSGHRDLVGAGNQLGRHVPHADVAELISKTHPKYLRSFATAKDRSSAVETGRSPGMPSRASRHRTGSNPREWLAGHHAGRATPQPQRDGGRKAVAQPAVKRGKILVPPGSELPRTPRFSGGEFQLRTGKRLPLKASEASIHFRPVPRQSFPAAAFSSWQPNRLVMHIQPDEGIVLRFQAKRPGPKVRLSPVDMRFSYCDAFKIDPPEAYETLLMDVINGDSTLFMRAEQVETTWSLLAPILDNWAGIPPEDGLAYSDGTWGPDMAEVLVARDGRTWLNPIVSDEAP